MTREEAIEIIKLGDIYNRWGKVGEEVEKMAIKALEQQTCEDAISRQAVKEQMIKYGFHAPDMTVTEFVENLPAVTPNMEMGYLKIIKKIQKIVTEWKSDIWTDNLSYECMVKVAELFEPQESEINE